MAEGSALRKEDVIVSGVFDDAIKSGQTFLKVIEETEVQIKSNISAQREFVATFQAKSFGDIEKLNKEIEKTNVLLRANEKLKIDQIKVEQQVIKLLAEEEKVLQQQQKTEQELIKTKQQQIKLDNQQEKALRTLNGEYKQGVARLGEIKKQLKELAFVGRDGGKVYKALSQEFTELDKRVRTAEQGVGEFQRNVGNYKSGFNGLGNSVNQLTREFPAFTNSVETGFLAISNNLPIFFDAISDIKKANADLRAEGQPTTSVFKQISSAIFSWGTALSVGVTLLTLYGAKLIEFITKVATGKNEIQAINEALQESYVESVKIYEKNIELFTDLAVLQGRLTQAQADNLKKERDINKQKIEVQQRFNVQRIKLAKELGITLAQFDGKFEETAKGKGRREGETFVLKENIKINKAFARIEKEKNDELAALDRQAELERRIRKEEEGKKNDDKKKKDITKIKDDSQKLLEQQIADELKLRNEIRKLEIEFIDDKFQKKEAEIDNNFRLAQEELVAIKGTAEAKKEALIQLEKNYYNDLRRLRKEQSEDALNELSKELDEEEKVRLKAAAKNQKEFDEAVDKAEKKKQADIKREIDARKELQRSLALIGEAIDRKQQQNSQRESERLDKRFEENKSAIERQQDLADKGLANTLAFEKQKAAQLEQERKRQVEKDIRNQKILSFYRLFTAYADKDASTALQKAALDISLSELIAGSFIDGTEKVSDDLKGNKVHSGQDGYVVAVDGNERILNPKQNSKIGDMSNDELVSIVTDYKSGKLFNYGKINEPKLVLEQPKLDVYFNKLNSTMLQVKQAIENKPTTTFTKDYFGNIVEFKTSGGNTKKTINKRTRI